MNYDRIILELMSRVSVLEDRVAALESGRSDPAEAVIPAVQAASPAPPSHGKKDRTRYLYNGRIYGKNQLVLAVVRDYARKNPGLSAEELMAAFERRLQGSLGVVRLLDEARSNCSDFEKRFFADSDEIIPTSTGDCVVCNQWGRFNIGAFLQKAARLGIEITKNGAESAG